MCSAAWRSTSLGGGIWARTRSNANRLAQLAGCRAGGRIHDDHAARRRFPPLENAAAAQRCRVHPDGVAVERAEIDGPVGYDGVQLPAIQPCAGRNGVVLELHAFDPVALRVGGRVGSNCVQDLGQGAGIFQAQLIELERTPKQVEVAVDQPRQQRAPAGVDHLRVRAAQIYGIGGAAYEDNPVAAHGYRFGAWVGRVGGIDRRIGEQVVSKFRHRMAGSLWDHHSIEDVPGLHALARTG